ncbi:MAG: DUF2029 domain-containing protein [Bacteroidetes bacterium]|nr:DUF2029 domain-containing protein [Bacteroidota bacterium]
MFITRHAPVGDFGNYYYGSRLWLDGKFSISDYQSISHFNEQIASYGEKNFFENYIPVPPFSLVFYVPFVWLSSLKARFLFNGISLLVFCFSWLRFLKRLPELSPRVYLVPWLFLFPLYNNIYHGQTYLLLAAAFMEIYIAMEAGRHLRSGLLLALCICLKIFPVFLLLYFLFRKAYKGILYTFVFSGMLMGATALLAGPGMVGYYVQSVLPRLFQNDIVGPYYYGNQSIYTLLLNLFSADALQNKTPYLNAPWLIPVIEGFFDAIVLYVVMAMSSRKNIALFGITLLASFMVGRYSTSYGMLMLIPFVVSVTTTEKQSGLTWFILAGVLLAINIPLSYLQHAPFMLMYWRILGLVLIFAICMALYKPRISWPVLLVSGMLLIAFRYLTFNPEPCRYFEIQNTQGILYDYTIKKDSITLVSTLGDHTFMESYLLNGQAKEDSLLQASDNMILYKGKMISESHDHKQKPFLLNDSLIVCMSDMNQAVGFYKLRYIGKKP